MIYKVILKRVRPIELNDVYVSAESFSEAEIKVYADAEMDALKYPERDDREPYVGSIEELKDAKLLT